MAKEVLVDGLSAEKQGEVAKQWKEYFKELDRQNKSYEAVWLEGADHFFNNMDGVLVKRVRGWLAKHAAGTELPMK